MCLNDSSKASRRYTGQTRTASLSEWLGRYKGLSLLWKICTYQLSYEQEIWPAGSYTDALLGGAIVDKIDRFPTTQNDQSRKRHLDGSPSDISSHTNTRSSQSSRSTRSDSVPPHPSASIGVFHPSTAFMELTHSLGLEPSGLDRVFGVSDYAAWPSNGSPFGGVDEDVIPHRAMTFNRAT